VGSRCVDVASCNARAHGARRAAVACVLALVAAGCGPEAVLVEVRADGFAAGAIDAFCLAAADRDRGGGAFGRVYSIDEVGGLPQSLAVEPGGASHGEAWARGLAQGIEQARDLARFAFDGDEVDLVLAACPGGPGGRPAEVYRAPGPTDGRLTASLGRGGSVVVLVGPGGAAALAARDGRLVGSGLTLPPVRPAGPAALHAFDADGDCDDDVLVVWNDAAPELWLRQATGFVLADGALPGAPVVRVAASADLDGDGDVDLALGGDTLGIWLNDGAGRFALQQPAIEGDAATDVTALGFADLDGDGDADLVVGRGLAAAVPSRVLFNNGGGQLATVVAALAEVDYQVRALALGDLNGDGAIDLLLAALGSPVKLYANRGDGRLEDRSFVSLPAMDPIDAAAVAVGDWDGDCLRDAIISQAAGGAPLSWRGGGDGALVDDGAAGATGTQLILADIDDDGDRDLVMLDGAEVVWAAR
jgi:hypothetical protein